MFVKNAEVQMESVYALTNAQSKKASINKKADPETVGRFRKELNVVMRLQTIFLSKTRGDFNIKRLAFQVMNGTML